jgi:hypothetical protein
VFQPLKGISLLSKLAASVAATTSRKGQFQSLKGISLLSKLGVRSLLRMAVEFQSLKGISLLSKLVGLIVKPIINVSVPERD